MNFRSKLTWKTGILGVLILLVVFTAGGVLGRVFLDIPDEQGVIHGCFKSQNGQLRLVESSSQCLPSEQPISWQQGQPIVSGFVYPNGTQYGNGFTVERLGVGHYELRFPTAIFSDFPAIGASAWGIPGQAPILNVVFNDFNNGSYRADIRIFAADGVTPIDGVFQFVAAEVR